MKKIMKEIELNEMPFDKVFTRRPTNTKRLTYSEAKNYIGYNQFIDAIVSRDEKGNAELYESDLMSPYDTKECIGVENNDGTVTLY